MNIKKKSKKSKAPVFGDAPLVKLDTDITKSEGEDVFNQIAKSGDYLPRIQLEGTQSKLVVKDQIKAGHFALIESDSFEDLTKSVDVLVLAWRAKALRTDGETVESDFDIKSKRFQQIQAESEISDSGCMFGPEFLLWVPSYQKFCTFFMASKSARREARNVKDKIGYAGTLTSKLIETKKYTWYAPEIISCTTPFDLPDPEEMMEQIEGFKNPPKEEEKEEVETKKGKRAR